MDPKKVLRIIPLIALVSLAFIGARVASASGNHPPSEYKAALVVDYASNEVLYEDRADEQADPASLVKMMVTLITLEHVSRGEMSLDDPVHVSAKTSRIGGHQVYLKQGEVFPLRELLKAVVIASANDASHAVAEHAAGSQERFVQRMNTRARELGMHHTRFANAHGLPPDRSKGEEENTTSAYDLFLLARELMKHPQAMKWASTQKSSFRGGKFILVNTNHRFLKRFEGADGFKTGYHPRGAGFNVVATAQRDGRRLVAIVLGANSSASRLKATTGLLQKGFEGKFNRVVGEAPRTIPVAVTASAPRNAQSNN